MTVYIVHTHVIRKGSGNAPPPEHYHAGSERFLKSYLTFKPTVPHELVIAHCNIGQSNGMFNGIASRFFNYNGHGWDCGTWQHAAASLDCDFMICCNSFSYFWKHGWLEPFIKAFREFGAGIYGPTASFETSPHIRTPCIAFSPSILLEYPIYVNSRSLACEAEAAPGKSFTQWALSKQYPVKLVTADACYDWQDWRRPANIFRRGDQSNVLIKDRHTEIYEKASREEKAKLAAAADGNA